MTFFRYMKSDIYRAFFSKKFLIILLLISIIPFLAKADTQGFNFVNIFCENSIFEFFNESVFWSEIGILNFILIAYVYADCFCDDLSMKYSLYNISRGNISGYVLSKAMVVFFVSIITYAIGMLLFALESSMFFGFKWELYGGESTNQFLYSIKNIDTFSGLISNGHYFTLYICMILLQALLYGLTSICSLMISLFIQNKLLVLCIPILVITIVNYILCILVEGYDGYKFVFSTEFFYMKSSFLALIQLLGGTILIIGILILIIRFKMRRIIVE